jgi:hypothetical protein
LCKDCCNPEIADFNAGTFWMNHIEKIRKYINTYDSLIDNIFLLGGSFNHQEDYDLKVFFLMMSSYSKKDIWLYAREEIEDVKPVFLEHCKYIKTGAYIPSLACDDNYSYSVKLATSNQKILKKGIDY